MEPSQRPRKERRGARVIVTCADSVLLMSDSDPGVPGSSWWVTPGGGLEPGDTSRDAAARELFEETGHRCDARDLVGPVARRRAVHGYSDRILVQDEEFFLLQVDERFTVSTVGFTQGERLRMGGWRWLRRDQLGSAEVWPAGLPEVLRAPVGSRCLDLGEVEESTVPV